MNYALNYRTAEEVNIAMAGVYKNMMLAVLNSMLISYIVGSSPALIEFLFTGILKWVVILSPLAMIIFMSFKLDSVSKSVAHILLHVFAALMGISFATIFVAYTLGSIFTAFMGAAVLFSTMSFYGYFTKRDLTGVGQFMIVGLIAIIIASIINIFIGSTVTQMVISALAIIVFLGLTAYDTQKIRELVSAQTSGNAEVMGAVTLYLDFINLFLNLLRLIGDRR